MASGGAQRSSLARLRAVAQLRSPHLAVARKAPLGLGFEIERGQARTLVELETLAGGVGQLSLPYSLRLLLDVLEGLSVLHEAALEPDGSGFVHGEVTPERVYLGPDGIGKLVPLVPGHWTPNTHSSPEWHGYLAPEALLGDAVDVRADVFSVGVMLWESLAAQRLFGAVSADEIVMRLMSGKVGAPELAGDDVWAQPLAAVAKRAISVNPRQRHASARELRAEIERIAGDHLASTAGMAELFRDPASGSRKIVAAPTVPRPAPPPAPSAPQPPSSAPRSADEVDALLASPPSSAPIPLRKPPSERPAPAEPPAPARNDQAGFFELPESPPPREGRVLLWLALVLVLGVAGALAYPPVRRHPAVAELLRKLPLPGATASSSAAVPAAKLVPADPIEPRAASEPAPSSEPAAQEQTVPGDAPSDSTSEKARRPTSRKVEREPALADRSPKPPPPEAEKPPPAVAEPPPEPAKAAPPSEPAEPPAAAPEPAPKPEAPATADTDQYGI